MDHRARLSRLCKNAVWPALLASHLWAAHATADELVQFESAAAKPTPFQQRIAQQNGQVLEAVHGQLLDGYLTRPTGEGPFPAVVVLPGCSGLSASSKKAWPERLSSWGYVVLVVDSLSTRGIKETCDRRHFVDRVGDAYGALGFLSRYGFVDPQRFSSGGNATLEALRLAGAGDLMERKFKAAIAYYPDCSDSKGAMAVPTLILIGELDDAFSAKKCQEMVAGRNGKGSAVQLEVFKGARHAFDSPGLKAITEHYGYHMEYNATAAEKSIGDVRVFLKEAFGAT